MTYQGRKPYPNCTDPSSRGLLMKSEVDVILTGHNHKPFVEEYNGKLLINPGSITRQEADDTHEPRVYLYNAETNTVEKHILPHEQGVVNAPESSLRVKERENRIDAFMSKLVEEWDSTLNFSKNLERFIAVNKPPQEIIEIINKHINK